MMDYLLSQWPLLLRLLPDLILGGWVLTSVVCRFNKMGPETSNVVALQYGAIFAGSVLGLSFRFVPELRAYDLTAVLSGVVVFMMLGANRWRDGAPEGTKKVRKQNHKAPYKIEPDRFKHVVGGVKK